MAAMLVRGLLSVALLSCDALSRTAQAETPIDPGAAAPAMRSAHPANQHFDCGYHPPAEWLAGLQAAVAAGQIDDPALRIPFIPAAPDTAGRGEPRGGDPCLSSAHIFPYEDSAGLLLTDFTDVQLVLFMAQAANALLAVHGDRYDFL